MAEVNAPENTALQEPGRSPEAWPTVLFDTSLGEMVTNIEVDIEYIADFLSRSGLSDEQIMGTTLIFDGETVLKGRRNEYAQYGTHEPSECEPDTYISRVHLGSARRTAPGPEEGQEYREIPLEVREAVSDLIASEIVFESAIHELNHEVEHILIGEDALLDEHLVHYQAEPKPTLVMRLVRWALRSRLLKETDTSELSEAYKGLETTNRRIAARKAKKKETHEQYKTSPAEIRAESVAEAAINQFKDVDSAEKLPVHASFKW
jgi:hypothetical protein